MYPTAPLFLTYQPFSGPGNSLVQETAAYNLDTKNLILDFHEYIVFGPDLYLTIVDDIIPNVIQYSSSMPLPTPFWSD